MSVLKSIWQLFNRDTDLSGDQKTMEGDQLIRDLRFVVFDTETTGLDVTKDNLISFGAVAVKNMTIDVQDSLEIIFNQNLSVASTVDIHGIMPQHMVEGIDPAVAMVQISHYINGSVLVAHHARFDRQMLQKSFDEYAPVIPFNNRIIDTAELAQRLEHFNVGEPYERQKYTLNALCERYDVEIRDRHTAAGDAFLTAQLLLKLLHEAELRGIVTAKDLFKKTILGLI